ncbi:MAG TPA: hypothetical protein VKD88_07245 [Gaiellaceae bacterium]|nr:hypothetical protein [Gaiellaceae bacterium]
MRINPELAPSSHSSQACRSVVWELARMMPALTRSIVVARQAFASFEVGKLLRMRLLSRATQTDAS